MGQTVLATAVLLALQTPAFAACDKNIPAQGDTITCSTSSPNPDATGVHGGAGVGGVTVNILQAAGINSIGPYAIEGLGSGWTVNNSGNIVARPGFLVGDAPAGGTHLSQGGNLVNSGAISADGVGVAIEIDEAGRASEIINTGRIEGMTAISMSVAHGGQARIVNSGTILGAQGLPSGGRGTGIVVDGEVNVTNLAGGLIAGGARGVGVLLQGSGSSSIDNAGAISGGDAAISANGPGASRTSIINRAGGSIAGSNDAITLGSLEDAVTNLGTITGSVRLGDGNDSLGLAEGSVLSAWDGDVGLAVGGAGLDRLTLAGSNTEDAKFVDFEFIEAMAGSRWTLAGEIATQSGGLDLNTRGDSELTLAGQVIATDLNKQGAGLLRVTGDNSAFGGVATVREGKLFVDGALGGTIEVEANAWLGGAGRVGTVRNDGTLAPGNGIGRLTFTGNYVHGASAMLLVDIAPDSTSDLLSIGGTATIEGGDVHVLKLPGQYFGGTRYTLINAAGGVSGQFSTLTQDLPFLDLRLAYDPNHVFLDIVRSQTQFAEACATFNQCQVAGSLDTISADQTLPEDLASALNELTTLDFADANATFDTLSGDAHASFATLMLESNASYGHLLASRMAMQREAMGMERVRGGAWVQGYGTSGDLEGNDGVQVTDYQYRGIAAGVDVWGSEAWLIGASLNAARMRADFREGDTGEADVRNVALYTSFKGERFYLDGTVLYGWSSNQIERTISIAATPHAVRADYDGHHASAYIETGLNFDLGHSRLQPLLSVEYATLKYDRFQERGAQSLDLIGDSHDTERTVFGAGARWSADVASARWTITPTAQVLWLHATGDAQATVDVAFAGAPDAGFRVTGAGWPEDRALASVGAAADNGNGLVLFAGYDYQAGSGLRQHHLNAGLRWLW